MTKRLQVILQDGEYRELQCVASARQITIAEWVRADLNRAEIETKPREADSAGGFESGRRNRYRQYPFLDGTGDFDARTGVSFR